MHLMWSLRLGDTPRDLELFSQGTSSHASTLLKLDEQPAVLIPLPHVSSLLISGPRRLSPMYKLLLVCRSRKMFDYCVNSKNIEVDPQPIRVYAQVRKILTR